MDSDSDSVSDVETVPVQRPTARRRKLVPIKSSDRQPSNSIYLSKVDQSMKALRQAQPDLEKTDSDVEDEPSELFVDKKKKRMSEHNKLAKKPAEAQNTISVELSDESDAENEDKSLNRSLKDRSPTPPPSDVLATKPKRAPRRTKAVKNALTEIDQLYFRQKLRTVAERITADQNDDVVIIGESNATPSPLKPLTVKVRSRSGLHRFNMKKSESFTTILAELAEQERVPQDRCVLFLNDKTIEPYETPLSINLHIADIFELHIRKDGELEEFENNVDLDDPDVIELSVQTKDPKSKLVLPIHKNLRLEKIMRDYAKQKSLVYEELTFYFDGDMINESQTPSQLEMETDDCIDVVITS